MIDIKQNQDLKEYTTMKVGGPARFFCELKNENELVEIRKFVQDKSLAVRVLGRGSNVVVSDQGFDGLVILNSIMGINLTDAANGVIEAGAGEEWDKLVQFAINNGLGGIECLSWVPGSVGAAPVMNIGCYGQEASETIDKVTVFNIQTGEISEFGNKQCQFGYRTSIFRQTENLHIVLRVRFKLNVGKSGLIRYKDLQSEFKDNAEPPTLMDVRNELFKIRGRKGMVLTPTEGYKSVGSFFKNPLINKNKFGELVKKIIDEKGWFWPSGNEMIKVSAAKIIEYAGFNKGDIFGNVGLSPKHPLAIINLGQASASDVKGLAERIKAQVASKTEVVLEEEAEFVGKFN